MAKQTKTRTDKIAESLKNLRTVSENISDYREILAALPEKSQAKAKRILSQFEADEIYLRKSLVHQGFMMIQEAGKIDAFINALPEILK